MSTGRRNQRTGAPRPARARFEVRGVVQGVGFRPFVYALATELGLCGSVRNTASGVDDRGRGRRRPSLPSSTAGCAPTIRRSPGVDAVVRVELSPRNGNGFAIAATDGRTPGRTLVAPDIATCDDCLAEFADPGDRRYRHAFISCTNCGPRFTVVTGLPYDRPNTTMANLPLCAAVRGRVRRPGRPPLPRPDRRLPRLRADAAARTPGRGRRPRCRRRSRRRAGCSPPVRSSPSRASVATTSPATPRTSTRSRRCASARTAATSRSP